MAQTAVRSPRIKDVRLDGSLSLHEATPPAEAHWEEARPVTACPPVPRRAPRERDR